MATTYQSSCTMNVAGIEKLRPKSTEVKVNGKTIGVIENWEASSMDFISVDKDMKCKEDKKTKYEFISKRL